MRKTLCCAAVAACAFTAAPVARAQGLFVSGYAGEEVMWSNEVKGASTHSNTFDAHHFNLIMLGQLRGDVFAAAEIEIESGGEEIGLEYGYLAFTRWPHANIIAGKFLVPFGRFNQDLHPDWVNKIPGRPLPNDAVFPVDYGDVGVMVRGALAAGTSGRVTYDVWGVNGLAGPPGESIRDLRDNRVDVDNNIAVGTRLGFVTNLGLDVGGSVYYGKYNDSLDLNLRIVGLDARYGGGPLELRGEWMQATQGNPGGNLNKSGFYLQGSYAVLPAVEVTARYSQVDFPGAVEDMARYSVGVSLYPSDAAAFRLAYTVNRGLNGGVPVSSIIAQFTVGF